MFFLPQHQPASNCHFNDFCEASSEVGVGVLAVLPSGKIPPKDVEDASFGGVAIRQVVGLLPDSFQSISEQEFRQNQGIYPRRFLCGCESLAFNSTISPPIASMTRSLKTSTSALVGKAAMTFLSTSLSFR